MPTVHVPSLSPYHTCECSDPMCPHPGMPKACTRISNTKVYRVDMEDREGTLMCEVCASDAMESGVFSYERPRDMQSRTVID